MRKKGYLFDLIFKNTDNRKKNLVFNLNNPDIEFVAKLCQIWYLIYNFQFDYFIKIDPQKSKFNNFQINLKNQNH